MIKCTPDDLKRIRRFAEEVKTGLAYSDFCGQPWMSPKKLTEEEKKQRLEHIILLIDHSRARAEGKRVEEVQDEERKR